VVTVVGLQFGSLLGGTVVTETVFARPGIGRIAVLALQAKDFPVAQGVVLFVALVYVFVNLVVDVLYAYVDPRIHYG
jgi:peptide/nickel transport system permease protein